MSNKKTMDYLPRTTGMTDFLTALSILAVAISVAWLAWRFYHWLATWTINASRHLNLILMLAVVVAFLAGRATVSKRGQLYKDGLKDGIDTVMNAAERVGSLRGQMSRWGRMTVDVTPPSNLPPIPRPMLPRQGYAGMLDAGDDDVVDGEAEEV